VTTAVPYWTGDCPIWHHEVRPREHEMCAWLVDVEITWPSAEANR
jgi:hypothetical protein